MNRVRCAIYTRKSSEEGLDQAFNSLDAQREACEAYIKSQKHEGWKALPAQYDDGGASGGDLDRPSLKRLLDEVDAGRVDMIVVYKIDRLTRSLTDFSKLIERLDKAGASFVSVTQQFNTSTSMGRLTLNVLLSFAQFEREVTAERIRDKIAASKKKGMWMGGRVPLGYDKTDAGLVINQNEAGTVRTLFEAYLDLGCVRQVKGFADALGLITKRHVYKSGKQSGGVSFSRGRLYHLLSNPIYIGKIRHLDQTYDGLHQPIIDLKLWTRVQEQLGSNRVQRSSRKNFPNRSPLAGRLYDGEGRSLTPSHADRSGRRYRYYVSKPSKEGKPWRLPAGELEAAILAAVSQDRLVQLQTDGQSVEHMDLIERVSVHDAQLKITVQLADNQRHDITAPFTMRRRGVESKLVLDGGVSREPDLVMVRRIHRAMRWVDRIKSGETVKAVAASENVSSDFVTHNIDLAYLSPEILGAILDGQQRADLTTVQLQRRRWPVDWSQQKLAFLA
jgi:DNA invertase Pin-like site-specific DNA recombinase